MDAATNGAAWSEGYVGVWHMDGDPSGSAGGVPDSSPSGKHGSALNMSADDLVEGMLGYTVRDVVLSGGADPFAALKAGTARWERWRALVAPHKDTLLCLCL